MNCCERLKQEVRGLKQLIEESPGFGTVVRETLTVGSNGQVDFVLSGEPLDPEGAEFFIGGQLQNYGVDYIIIGTNLTWLDVDFVLSTTDQLTIFYTTN